MSACTDRCCRGPWPGARDWDPDEDVTTPEVLAGIGGPMNVHERVPRNADLRAIVQALRCLTDSLDDVRTMALGGEYSDTRLTEADQIVSRLETLLEEEE